MPVCPRQCHFGCVLVGIEHGVHEREARVALDAGGVVALAVLARFCQFVSTVVVRQCCVLSGLMALCVRRNAQGGAIYASSSSSINIQHTTFVGNQAVCMSIAAGSCHDVSCRHEACRIRAVERAMLHW